MKFGKHFEKELVPEWRVHYLQYNALKETVKQLADGSSVDASGFHALVRGQIQRATTFYDLQRATLERDLSEANRAKAILANPLGNAVQDRTLSIERLLLNYQHLGTQVTRLFHFLQLNATALRKILKKFNKRVSAAGPTLLGRVQLGQDDVLAQHLARLRDISLLQPSIESIQRGIIEMQSELSSALDPGGAARHQAEISGGGGGGAPAVGGGLRGIGVELSPVAAVRLAQYRDRGAAILQDMYAMRERMRGSNEFLSFLSSRAVIPFRPTLLRQQSKLGKDPGDFRSVRARAVSAWSALVGREGDAANAGAPLEDTWSESINLASTFFYLANYNICLPTAGRYAVQLGLRASVAGVIVAMTPIAALASAVVYSFWTNRSFREPLLASSVLLVLGNLLYAVAWDARLSSLLLIGRFVSGLGACRAANRRYIADTISVQNRTRASAAFVAAGALGMASGPLLASLFADMDIKVLGFTVNEMTGPAWFMAVLWVFFGLLVLFRFRDPPRAVPQLEDGDLRRAVSDASEFGLGGGGGGGEGDDEVEDDEDEDEDSVGTPTRRAGWDVYEDEDNLLDTDDPSDPDDGGFDDSIDIVLEGSHSLSEGSSNGKSRSYGTMRIGDGKAEPGGSSHKVQYERLASRRRARRETQRWRLTVYSLCVIFWVKLVQEALLTAIPITAPDGYGWATRRIGLFMTALGLFVVPCNMALVAASRAFALQDSFWLRALFLPLALLCAALVPYRQEPLALPLFVLGDLGVFALAQVMEGVMMSLFSKIISSKLAAGTCNSGLLATEAGTLGRAAGNAVITVLGAGTALELQFNLFVFCAAVSLACWLVSIWVFSPRRA